MIESGKTCSSSKQFMSLKCEFVLLNNNDYAALLRVMKSACATVHPKENNFSLQTFIREFTKGVNGTVDEECAHKNQFSIPSLDNL